MAFLEWRQFNFFDTKKGIDDKKIAELLQETTVTCVTHGNAHVVIADENGWVHLVTRAWQISSFKAYEVTVTLAKQFQHDPFLVTIGEDEAGIKPQLKVWDWSRKDRHGNPVCVRVCRASSHTRPTQPTALALHDNKNLIAVGFSDGSVVLFCGDVTRLRSSKMRTLTECGTTAVTGLAFKGSSHLFVCCRSGVFAFALESGAGGSTLDAGGGGCRPGCAALTDQQNFMVARNDAIYCYTLDGRGPCYALEGEKKRIDCFRSYLVITTTGDKGSNSYKPQSSTSESDAERPRSNHITILDVQNKFIVYSQSVDEVEAVLTEWGSIYILTKKNELYHLDEKDLKAKLEMLFKKNLFDVAIRIATSQHYDAEGLTAIYKQYGDHLYKKGDPKGAVEQYIKTIGSLESSYVIRKYLESRQLEALVRYLQELHARGLATEHHTTLLLTCFVKSDQHDQLGKLKQFLANEERLINFDVEIALKVCRQVSADDALVLAEKHHRHEWYLAIMLEDKDDPAAALQYIVDLDFEDAHLYMKKYGNLLIQKVPKESTDFLKVLCSDYKPRSHPLVDEDTMLGGRRRVLSALPDDYIHLFLNNSQRLVEFLEHMIHIEPKSSKLVYNVLIEHYIHVWSNLKGSHSEQQMYCDKIVSLLKSPDVVYDGDHALLVCQMMGFKPGMMFLYEEKKLYGEMLRMAMRAGDADGVVGVCERFGRADPQLWLLALWWPPPPSHLPHVLNVIAKERLLSPVLVIDCLASTTGCTLGDVRSYLTSALQWEMDVGASSEASCVRARAECAHGREVVERLRGGAVTFQDALCAACKAQLELPSVHFLCKHSYHQHCFESVAEADAECPLCASSWRRDSVHSELSLQTLHTRLREDTDSFSVLSDGFARGLFSKPTVIVEEVRGERRDSPPAPSAPTPPAPRALAYGPGAEARLRLAEGNSTQGQAQSGRNKGSSVIPMPEGRMRLLEQRTDSTEKYSSSLEANINRSYPAPQEIECGATNYAPVVKPTDMKIGPSKIQTENPSKISSHSWITKPAASSTNPFGHDTDKNYECRNPFDSDEEPSNPFGEDDDYDKNLNPFS